ncbi:MAG: ribonuclease III [Treponema sp.]|jgi:ribonuclease-3|nr:ribonuclease III [Treponema sp.]
MSAVPSIAADRKAELRVFSKSVGIRFKSPGLLNLSLTHRSVSNEVSTPNNERLEFLGDAILGAVTASILYQNLGEKNEGELAKIKSVVVSEDTLAGIALELSLDKVLVLGKGEELTGGRTKKAILADALEALIGALYLDGGFGAAFGFVAPRVESEITRVLEQGRSSDYKSLLQELCQRRYKNCPRYTLIKRTGPEHDRRFWIEVSVNGTSYGPCTGRSKKSAEQEAAALAFAAINGR